MNGDENLVKVQVVRDDSGHWYVIPNELKDEFNSDSEDEDMCDSGGFDYKYSKYRTSGDLNLIQLWANV